MSEQSHQPSSGSWPTEPDLPMPDQGPVEEELSGGERDWPRPEGDQVTLGLENRADDPDTARPLEHPRALLGEEPATGDIPQPG